VPLCRIHHREVHRGGNEGAWWNRFGVDPHLVAAALWAQTRPVRSAEPPNYDQSTAPPTSSSSNLDPTSVARPNGPEIAKRSQLSRRTPNDHF
jgi:hypothetical protein